MSGPVDLLGPDRPPPPFAAGPAPPRNVCAEGAPPLGWEFLGARSTVEGWLLPCPACGRGWAGLLPDGRPYGYRLALELRCTLDCEPELIAWWHLWRNGALPPPPAPDERARRYALAVARGAIRDLAEIPPERDRAGAFARAAYRVGQAKALGGLDEDGIALALVEAGAALGLSPADAAALAQRNFLAGVAAPLRSPR